MRLGILGGTFNPPHLAHLICGQEALVQLGLERIVLIPTNVPPHKRNDEDDPGAAHRLELCRLAVGDDERFAVSEIELDRPGPSYTVDTLKELHERAPDNELFFIVGGDIAAGLPDWREPERVLSLATLAVAQRAGTPRDEVAQALGRLKGGEEARFFEMPSVEISSTAVRERVRAAQPIRYLVPDRIAAYINDHGLYEPDGGSHQT